MHRNPTVGYYQGMNYLVFRLRKVLNEEETFWMMCMIVEVYLPPDFYVDMYGAKTYATILETIFKQYSLLPAIMQKFEDMCYPVVNIGSQLFLSLFTMCLPEH